MLAPFVIPRIILLSKGEICIRFGADDRQSFDSAEREGLVLSLAKPTGEGHARYSGNIPLT